MQTPHVSYRFWEEADLVQVIDLLRSNGLPSTDVTLDKVLMIIATCDNQVIGCMGLEAYEEQGLLRSFAVESNFRNQGIGNQLYLNILSHCHQIGVRHLHALTDTAEDYFISRGFSPASRKSAPISITSTTEFSTLCPESCSYLVKKDLHETPKM